MIIDDPHEGVNHSIKVSADFTDSEVGKVRTDA